MDFSQTARAYHKTTHRFKMHISRLSASDRVAGALILAGTLLAAMCLTTTAAHSAGL